MPEAQTRANTSRDRPPDPLVRTQLARILASDIFSRSDRLTAFLTFIVEETLDGHGETLKEHVLAMELYGKGTDFNSAGDPIVRVDARRLRDKLREYYAAAPHDPVVISVLKGSYTPTFEANGVLPVPVAERAFPLLAWRRRLWIAGAAIAVLAAVGWPVIGAWRGRSRPEAAPMRILTATSFPGSEGMPSFSPDGNFVVFIWSGPVSPGINDLWVKSVEGEALRQLTNTPSLHEAMPAWSPDGQQIAFYRIETAPVQQNRGVFLISPVGGPERKIADTGSSPSWLPDGRSLVLTDTATDEPSSDPPVQAIFQQTLDTGERRRLTRPPPGFNDMFPSVSPDGRTLAFVRSSRNLNQAAVFIVPITGGEPTRRGEWIESYVGRLGWTPDGRDILYPRQDTSGLRVFRIAASGSEPGVLVPGLPFGVNMLAVSLLRADGTFRVAVGAGQPDVGLRLIDLQKPRTGTVMAAVTPFCDATRVDAPGRFSRDGQQVAFTSDRSGNQQVWVAGRDGSSLRMVTAFPGSSVNVGSWSPDGLAIAFDAVVAGNSDIYVVSADGGPVRRVTTGAASDIDAEWSRDGRWIYFSSNESGRSEIWKTPASGGTSVQLTTHGGFEPRESLDGRSIYYVDGPRTNGLGRSRTLRQISAAGGDASVVIAGIAPGAWDLTDTGVLFVTGDAGPTPPLGVNDALDFYSFSDRRVHRVGELPFAISRFGVSRVLAASRDGRWALGSHIDSWERDILVADHMR